MKIAVLAWGSLIWNQGDLAVARVFAPDGPRLLIEFCRISGKHAAPRRLTLVIDEAIGVDCLTYSAQSALGDLDAAKENLRLREGMPNINGIGFVDLATGTESQTAVQRHPAAVHTIRAWAKAKEYHAVIWTALDSNFGKPAAAREAFSVEAAVRFMEARPDDERECALNYIRKAPSEVQTPVRAAVAARWPQG